MSGVTTHDFDDWAESHGASMNEHDDIASESNTRIDQPHAIQQDEIVATPRRRKRREPRPDAVRAATAEGSAESQAVIAPVFVPESPETVPEIVVHQADDISLHLAERLREVERRELAAAEYEQKLQEAEAAARVWVMERDVELTSRERLLRFRTDELSTSEAACAAAQIAAEEELRSQQAALAQREAELQQRMAEAGLAAEAELNLQRAALKEREAELERRDAAFLEREERLQGERAALSQALDKLRAERRREEELHRSRQQKWQALLEADRAQAERTLINLQKHRDSLDQRERALAAKEVLSSPPLEVERSAEVRTKPEERTQPIAKPAETEAHVDLDLSVLRAEATRDHRLALEHRWIAGQLWTRLVDSGLASDEELQTSLKQVRNQLELLYLRERESLEVLRSALSATARQLKSTPAREGKAQPKPRALAFTG